MQAPNKKKKKNNEKEEKFLLDYNGFQFSDHCVNPTISFVTNNKSKLQKQKGCPQNGFTV